MRDDPQSPDTPPSWHEALLLAWLVLLAALTAWGMGAILMLLAGENRRF